MEKQYSGWRRNNTIFFFNRLGQAEVVQALLDEGGGVHGGDEDFDLGNDEGGGEKETARPSSSASVDPVAADGTTPIFWAAVKGHLEVVK